MQVILLNDIKGIGQRGQAKAVAEGYYRNFLQPQGLAVRVGDPRATTVRAALEAKAAADATSVEVTQQLAKRLDGQRVEITAKAKGERLFAAIHEAAVADMLGIDQKMIKMTSLKTLGEHVVRLELAHGLTARLTVNVRTA